ncbi:MAG: divalent-cation tolerance protein CutA [Alphaproteobacteria bacterium]|nr:divalent-cation tolerance protein CutA [Alphaproteobacteria bacterium]
MSQVLFVYVTASDAAEAERIGEAVVDERLAACANILDGMRSIFRWQGSVQKGQEAILILKTREDLLDALKERIAELHSYELPCIVALPIAAGHEPFLDWVASETGPTELV